MPKSKKKYGIGGSGAHGPTVELTLPSYDENGESNVALVRRLGVQGLIKMGILDSMDSLTGLVSNKILEITGEADAEQLKKIAEASPELRKVLDLVDKITLAAVVQPPVRPVPTEQAPDPERPADAGVPWDWRNPTALYVDDVDLEDKMFIMNFVVGGSGDLSAFRQATEPALGSVEDVEDVPVPPQ
jgi:hypothetical protein